MRSMRFALACLATAAALAIAAPAALAAPPTVVEKHGVHVLDIPAFIDCGEAVLDYHLVVRRTITERYDKAGELLRWELSSHYKATLADPVSGLVIRDDGSRKLVDDVVRQQTTITGGAHHVTWPGRGLVFGETGRVGYDWNGTPDDFDDDVLVFAAGIHQDAQAHELLCSILP